MRPLSVLLLSDGRPGHYHLAEGVIAALARSRPVAVDRLDVRRRKWLPGRVLSEMLRRGAPARLILSIGYGIDAARLPAADVVVSAGGETLVANAAAARLANAHNIFCGSLRRLPPEAFSLVVSSYARHASLPRHIVTLKPNGIDPNSFDRPAGSGPLGPSAPPKQAGLLIGGDSGYFRYDAREWTILLDFLRRSHAAHGTRWLVSTSRRSPGGLGGQLASLSSEPQSPISDFVDYRTSGPGTLLRIFARSEAILCTEDSSTMISEAVCARLPVIGVAPVRHGFTEEEQQYRDFMRERGWCRFLGLADLTPGRFLHELGQVVPLAENHLDALAATLRHHLPRLFP